MQSLRRRLGADPPARTALSALIALAIAGGGASAGSQDTDAWIAEVESGRAQEFVRPPRLEWLPRGAPFQAARSRVSSAIPIECPAPGFEMRRLEGAFADPETDRVVAGEGADPLEVKVALAHLLDAQLHPERVREAAALPGDAGEALRALLAASACAAAQGGFGPAPEQPAGEPFSGPMQEVLEPGAGAGLVRSATAAASTFLQHQADREAVFRRPPRSTAELLFPGRWERDEGARQLLGQPPSPTDCRAVRDESLGVFSFVRALVERGGRVPTGVFEGWEGDRVVVYACEDGRRPWVYVALFSRDGDAADFSAAAGTLLPAELARPFEVEARGRRAVAWRDLEAADARSFASALRAERSR